MLLSASACGSWLTLRELSRTTRFGEASISAQIRHLRKPECGGFVIEKRVRVAGDRSRRSADPRWEYRMSGSSALEAVTSWRTAEILRDAIETARQIDSQTSESIAS